MNRILIRYLIVLLMYILIAPSSKKVMLKKELAIAQEFKSF